MLEMILSDVEKHLGLKAIKGKQENDGAFTLKISDTEEVVLRDLNPGVLISSRISSVPEGAGEDFYIHLMKANILGQGTGGSILSLDPNEKFLTLISKISYEVNYKIFKDKLEEFLNFLNYWRSLLKNYDPENSSF